MVIRFSDYSEQLRTYIEKIVNIIYDNSNFNDETTMIQKYFLFLKNSNENFYKELLGLFVSDHYKNLYDTKKFYGISSNEEMMLNLYEELSDKDSIIDLLEENPEILIETIDQMCEFNRNDYFTKREIINNCRDKRELLFNFSTFNFLDYLYYCQKYNGETLKIIYNDLIDNTSKRQIITNIIQTLNELCISDMENYKELICEILIDYYKISRYQLSNKEDIVKKNNLMKTNRIIENVNQIELLNRLIKEDKFIFEIIKRYISFKGNVTSLSFNDEKYNNTVKKITRIKEI